MRIGYVIGELGRGGAELQLMRLAEIMVGRGHEVEVLAYGGPSQLDDELRRAGVSVRVGSAHGRLAKLRVVRDWMLGGRFDVVHAMLNHVARVCLLARLPLRQPPIIVTDFSSATYGARRPIVRLTLGAYVLADRVVTESELNRRNIARIAPWLRSKTLTVRNGLDLTLFSPPDSDVAPLGSPFRFCAVGSVYRVKNPLRVIDAVIELVGRGYTDFRVDWYGRIGIGNLEAEGREALAYAQAAGAADRMTFHGEITDVADAYRRSDALVHVSLREGFPNVVAEAMASGLPLVVGRISDLPEVVEDAENGFVVDQEDVEAIADGMERMLTLEADERRAMGARSRSLAVRWFSLERFGDDFERLYDELSASHR